MELLVELMKLLSLQIYVLVVPYRQTIAITYGCTCHSRPELFDAPISQNRQFASR